MTFTTPQILGLIVVVIVVITIVLTVADPTALFGEWGGQMWNFNDFCIVWSSQSYQPGLNGLIQVKNPNDGGYDITRYNITQQCSGALGKPVIDDSDIEKCRDLCKR